MAWIFRLRVSASGYAIAILAAAGIAAVPHLLDNHLFDKALIHWVAIWYGALLAALFFRGARAANPFKTIKVRAKEEPFEGQRFPSYFKFKDKDYGTELCRNCHINMRFRIAFETDAANDYLTRNIDPGKFSLYMVENGSRSLVEDRSINLSNGIANLSVRLPNSCCEGDKQLNK